MLRSRAVFGGRLPMATVAFRGLAPNATSATSATTAASAVSVACCRFNSTMSPSQRVRSAAAAPSSSSAPAASGASSFAQRVKMASAAAPRGAAAAAAGERVRPVEPPMTARDDGAAPVKKVLRKKKLVRKAPGAARASGGGAVGEAAAVSTGDALRRELRGIPSEEEQHSAAAGEGSHHHHQQQQQQQRYQAEEEGAGAHAAEGAGDHSAPAPGQKTSLVKGYRIDEVASLCSPSDAIFARRLPSGGCQFFAWPGTPLEVASAAIVSMPDTIRTVHAVFGRYRTPIDLVMDIDCPVPQEHWSMAKVGPFQKRLLDDTLSVVTAEIEKLGLKIQTQVVLQSPNLKKASFHVHTKIKDAAFADYNSLHGFLHSFHDRVPHVDLQIYRPNGMLRMFSCMKENHTSAMAVFDDPDWNIGFRGGRVPESAAALHSVVVRPEGTYKRLLTFDPPRGAFYNTPGGGTAADAADESGRSGSGSAARPPTVLLPRTEREAVGNASRWLRGATEVEVAEWRTWIGLGLCAFRIAHQFKDATTLDRNAMDEMLEAWVEASRHCPTKFRHGDCEQRWATFDIQKLQSHSDWWTAYQRLGKLEAAMRENMAAAEEIEKKKAVRTTRPQRR